MKYLMILMVLFVSTSLSLAEKQALAGEQSRLKRADSYFGIHFDFHAGPDCTEVGKNTTSEMVNAIIDKVHPDYIQVDSKGHAGYTSYPTKVGNQVPGYVGDQLRLWREETAKRGVALYLHHSGVWDFRACELHPDWAAVDKNGNPSKSMVSVFGPYADRLLIPQLKEIAGDYGIDGVWVDGECWATVPDYGERAVKLFRETTGILEDIPKNSSHPGWFEWMQFHREAFRQYMRHYVAEVKTTCPEFQICGNWAFTDHMPEAVSVAVDFLSGDYSPQDSVNSARYSGRYLIHQGVPWDLMAWSFSLEPRKQKTAVQLKREAAVVLALGGGFQAYFTQNRDASVRVDEMDVMGEVAKFARERQPYCHHSVQIPQVAVLNATAAIHRNSPGLFARYEENNKVRGVLQCLLEGQNSVDLVGEHTLGRDMNRYPLIVIPEWSYLPQSLCDDLVEYAKNGGSLFVIGEKATSLFTNLAPETRDSVSFLKVGDGQIAFLSKDIGLSYAATQSEELRALVNDAVKKLFPNPKVEVTGSPWVDVSVSKLGDKLTVHLVNSSGNHRDLPIIETIDPVGPLQVTIRSDVKPAKITLEPEGKNYPFDYQDGKATLTVESVPIYSILVVENE